MSQLNENNYDVFFSKNSCTIARAGEVFALTGDNGIFIFNAPSWLVSALMLCIKDLDILDVMHRLN